MPRVLKTNGTAAEPALGRSRGGCSTQIHVLVDGVGNPLRLHLTTGQWHARPPAPTLLSGLACDGVIAERG